MSEEKKENLNLRIWNAHYKTPDNYLKDVSFGGRKFKSIDPYYQIKCATHMFGACGKGWGVDGETFTAIGNGTVMLYQAKLWYMSNDTKNYIPLHSDIRITTSKGGIVDDWSKKLATDALTKGLSKIGISADVFMGEHDNKYNDNNQGRL